MKNQNRLSDNCRDIKVITSQGGYNCIAFNGIIPINYKQEYKR